MPRQDYLRSVGAVAIGGRLRRLSERIDREAAGLYKRRGVKFEQRWFGLLNQLRLNGPMSVTEIASALRISHASVSQSRKSLENAGLIVSRADTNDARRRSVELSDAGQTLIKELAPLWRASAAAAAKLVEVADGLMTALDQLEDALDERSFDDRTIDELSKCSVANRKLDDVETKNLRA